MLSQFEPDLYAYGSNTYITSVVLVGLNSATNPFIYTLCSSNFRRNIRGALSFGKSTPPLMLYERWCSFSRLSSHTDKLPSVIYRSFPTSKWWYHSIRSSRETKRPCTYKENGIDFPDNFYLEGFRNSHQAEDIANTMSDRNTGRGIRSCSEHPDRKGQMMMTTWNAVHHGRLARAGWGVNGVKDMKTTHVIFNRGVPTLPLTSQLGLRRQEIILVPHNNFLKSI